MTDSLFDGDPDAGPAGDDARRTGRRRSASGRNRERSRASSGGGGGGRSGFGEGGRGRGSRPRADGASATGPDGAAGAAGPLAEGMDDPEAVARGICLRALTGAARTRQQLAELLARKDVPADAAEAVLDRFTEVGLIDDAAFAAAWVSSRQAGRGLARRALASELRAKGVDGEVAAAAVAEVDPQEEWDAARRLVQRKAPAMRRLDRVTAERRLVGMLARKGYGGGLAGIVVREALDELHADDDLDAEAVDPDEAPGPAAARDAAGDDREDAGDVLEDAGADGPTSGALGASGASSGWSRGGGLGGRASGRGLGASGGGAGKGGFGRSTGFGTGGFGGRKPSRRAGEGKPNGSALGGGGAGGIAGQRASSMADEVGEGHGAPISRRPERS